MKRTLTIASAAALWVVVFSAQVPSAQQALQLAQAAPAAQAPQTAQPPQTPAAGQQPGAPPAGPGAPRGGGPGAGGGRGGGRAALTPRINRFDASRTSIKPGESIDLRWSTEAGDPTIDNGIGPVYQSGSVRLTPKATTTYTLSMGPNVTRSVTVTAWSWPASPMRWSVTRRTTTTARSVSRRAWS